MHYDAAEPHEPRWIAGQRTGKDVVKATRVKNPPDSATKLLSATERVRAL